jgi:hypothetical protein
VESTTTISRVSNLMYLDLRETAAPTAPFTLTRQTRAKTTGSVQI